MRAAALAIGAALAVCACGTDVSTSADFGTQGVVFAGIDPVVQVRGVAAGRDGVFWATQTALEYCPRSGCSAPVDVELQDIARVVTDEENVYWTELVVEGNDTGARVRACPQVGCTGPGIVLWEEIGTPNVIASDTGGAVDLGFLDVYAEQVYWTTKTSTAMGTTVTLNGCGNGGCSPPSQLVLPPRTTPIAVRGGTLYARRSSSVGDEIVTCPVATPFPQSGTCQPTVLVSSLAVDGATFDGPKLYVESSLPTSPSPGIISVCTPPSCTAPQQLFETAWYPDFVVAGGTLFTESTPLPGFAACNVAECSGGPKMLDFPFSPVLVTGTEPAILAADANGAYAYAVYEVSSGSIGIPPYRTMAIVYLPAPP